MIHARAVTNQLSALVALHLWHAQLHCDLHRIAMPGFAESAHPSFFADAPQDWVSHARTTCYSYAREVGRVFVKVHNIFSDFVPRDIWYIVLVYESCRNQLQYVHILNSEIVRDEGLGTYEIMISTVRRMTIFYPSLQSMVSDM